MEPQQTPTPQSSPPQVYSAPRKTGKLLTLAIALLVIVAAVLVYFMWPRPPVSTAAPKTAEATTEERAAANTQRKNDASTIAASINEFMSNSLGLAPTQLAVNGKQLVICGSDCTDNTAVTRATLNQYSPAKVSMEYYRSILAAPDASSILIVTRAQCTTDEKGLSIDSTPGGRSLAILFAYDVGGGKIEQHCQKV